MVAQQLGWRGQLCKTTQTERLVRQGHQAKRLARRSYLGRGVSSTRLLGRRGQVGKATQAERLGLTMALGEGCSTVMRCQKGRATLVQFFFSNPKRGLGPGPTQTFTFLLDAWIGPGIRNMTQAQTKTKHGLKKNLSKALKNPNYNNEKYNLKLFFKIKKIQL